MSPTCSQATIVESSLSGDAERLKKFLRRELGVDRGLRTREFRGGVDTLDGARSTKKLLLDSLPTSSGRIRTQTSMCVLRSVASPLVAVAAASGDVMVNACCVLVLVLNAPLNEAFYSRCVPSSLAPLHGPERERQQGQKHSASRLAALFGSTIFGMVPPIDQCRHIEMTFLFLRASTVTRERAISHEEEGLGWNKASMCLAVS